MFSQQLLPSDWGVWYLSPCPTWMLAAGWIYATFQVVFSHHCSLLLEALCHTCSFHQEGAFLLSYQSLLCGCYGLIQLRVARVVASSTNVLLGVLLCTHLLTGKTEGRWELLITRTWPQIRLKFNYSSTIKCSGKIKGKGKIRNF